MSPNVRTYVHDLRGRTGIWFLSLDAARLPAVLAARARYWLPYFWSHIAVRVTDQQIAYHSERRRPCLGGCDVALPGRCGS